MRPLEEDELPKAVMGAGCPTRLGGGAAEIVAIGSSNIPLPSKPLLIIAIESRAIGTPLASIFSNTMLPDAPVLEDVYGV